MSLESVALGAFALAVACFAFAGVLALRAKGASSRGAAFALVAGLLLVTLAAAAAAIDAKVAPGDQRSARAGTQDASGDERGGADAGDGAEADYFASRMGAFRGRATLRSAPLRKRLCLVRYYERATARANGDPGANWWTTCPYDKGLETIAEVRERLALPHAWGKRDARVIAEVPADERVTFLRGRAAPQCEPTGDQCYDGGGVQLLFDPEDFESDWFVRYECAQRSERARNPFEPCTG
jgi:hypothetical protein